MRHHEPCWTQHRQKVEKREVIMLPKSALLKLVVAATCVCWIAACGLSSDPDRTSAEEGDPAIGTAAQAAKGGNPGKPGGDEPGGECGSGVHLCNIVDAYKKCGVSGKKKNLTWDPTDPARNAMCCCHSDVCPEVCC